MYDYPCIDDYAYDDKIGNVKHGWRFQISNTLIAKM